MGEQNGKNIPKENNYKRNHLFPTRVGEKKMIAEISIPLIVAYTSSLTAAFFYYNAKYRKFIKTAA